MILLGAITLILTASIALGWRGGDVHDFDKRRTLPLRGIAALMVVFYHVACNLREVRVLSQALMWGDIAVTLFFFISGYGLMISYINKGDKYLDGFIVKRFAKLLPPFLIAAIGYEIYQSTKGSHSTIESLTAIAHGGTVLPDSWFIITIMIYYLLFYACAKWFRKNRAVVMALWCATAAYVSMCYALGWESYWYKTVCAINVGFSYALLEGKIRSRIEAHRSVLVCGTGIIALALLALWTARIGTAASILFPLLVVAAVYALGMWQNRTLNFLGAISYEIYIMQCIWRHKLYVTAQLHWSIYLVVTLALTIITAWMLHALCKKLPIMKSQ